MSWNAESALMTQLRYQYLRSSTRLHIRNMDPGASSKVKSLESLVPDLNVQSSRMAIEVTNLTEADIPGAVKAVQYVPPYPDMKGPLLNVLAY